jgi:hypothetical protein
MTNVNVAANQLVPYGDSKGRKLGVVTTAAKAAQNDTVTITNAKGIDFASVQIVATGAAEGYTVSNNVITCTSATTGSVKLFLVYY